MDENRTLYRLKELEFIEKITEKLEGVRLTGGGPLLEQMRDLFLPGSEEKDSKN